MLVSSSCGYLPPSFSTSFFMDATGVCPGGVWYSSLIHVTARASDQGPGHCTVLTGVVAARRANMREPSNNVCTTTSVQQVRRLCASLALYGWVTWRC